MGLKFKYAVVLFWSISIGVFAQSKSNVVPKSYIAYHTTENIKIDGSDADASWNKVEWTDLFIDIEGVKKPTYNTQVKMMWDDTYFYILAKMEEPHVWADIKDRDAIVFYNNDFEVFVDPTGDTHNYYELEVNAINTVWDLFITNPYREKNVALNDWTITGLKSAVKIDGTLNDPTDTDKGWVLEMAIPWSVYKTAFFHKNVPKDSFWRVNFSRVNWDHQITDRTYDRKKGSNGEYLPEYNWVWSPQGVINMHEPEHWGYVYFSSKEVGAKDTFEIPNDEKIKWKLFEFYRAQKKYFDTKKAWATSLKNIASKPIHIAGKRIKPVLENHSFGWTISVKSPFSSKVFIINEVGTFSTK